MKKVLNSREPFLEIDNLDFNENVKSLLRRRLLSIMTGAALALVGTHVVDFAEDARYRYMRPIGAIQIPVGTLGPLRVKLSNGVTREYPLLVPPFLMDRMSSLAQALEVLKKRVSLLVDISANKAFSKVYLGDQGANNVADDVMSSLNALYYFMYMVLGLPLPGAVPRTEIHIVEVNDGVAEISLTNEFPPNLRETYRNRLRWFERLSEDMGVRSYEDIMAFLTIHALALTLSYILPRETHRPGSSRP